MVKNKPNLNNPPVATKPSQPLSPEIIQQILDNQTKELEIRTQELALKRQEDDHSFEFSKKALDAQLTDRKMQRESNRDSQKNFYLLIGFIAIIITIVVLGSLYFDKEAIAIEIIKATGFILTGGIGGYGVGKTSAQKNKAEADTDEDM